MAARHLGFAIALCLVVCQPAIAQTGTTAGFASLLHKGDVVWLTTRSGIIHEGTVLSIGPTTIDLRGSGMKSTVTLADVWRVDAKVRDTVKDGLLTGLLIGAAGGAVFGFVGSISSCHDSGIVDLCSPRGFGLTMGGGPADGAGLGLAGGIGAAAHWSFLYLCPPPPPRPAPGAAGIVSGVKRGSICSRIAT